MAEMHYRNMELSDYDATFALWRHCEGISLREADSIDGIAKYLERNPGLSFVATEGEGDGETIVASIMAGHDGKRGYIQHLAVADELRKTGVGARLVALSLAALKSEGIVKSHVHVLGENSLARNFWVNRGWMQRAEIVMYSFINGSNKDA